MTTSTSDPKATLQQYLDAQRDAIVWKLEGLSARDARWPVTPTGTNLLGLVKHLSYMEYGYFGATFGRIPPEALIEMGPDAPPNFDMWATPDETCESVLAFYARACAHSDVTIESLDLDVPGVVPWWNDDSRNVTLHTVLVHMTVETARHAGHADILRELIDGAAGYRRDDSNLPQGDDLDWVEYVEQLKVVAESAGRAAAEVARQVERSARITPA